MLMKMSMMILKMTWQIELTAKTKINKKTVVKATNQDKYDDGTKNNQAGNTINRMQSNL